MTKTGRKSSERGERWGASGHEQLLGCPPGVTCCPYTTSDTLKEIALFFSYKHLNDMLVSTGRMRPGQSRNKRFSHKFPFPGKNGLWNFTGLSSSALSTDLSLSVSINKEATVALPGMWNWSGRAWPLSRGAVPSHCCGPGDPSILCKLSLG